MQVFAVGDNPAADVRGANRAGPPWVSCLVRASHFYTLYTMPRDQSELHAKCFSCLLHTSRTLYRRSKVELRSWRHHMLMCALMIGQAQGQYAGPVQLGEFTWAPLIADSAQPEPCLPALVLRCALACSEAAATQKRTRRRSWWMTWRRPWMRGCTRLAACGGTASGDSKFVL